jgi:hypothetical protein
MRPPVGRRWRVGHLPICFGPTSKSEGPGPDTTLTPGLRHRGSHVRSFRRLYMPASPPCCPARCGGRRAVSEPICRVYRCRRCGIEAWVCQGCDHGQIYCAGECSRICRRESLQRAGARYQRTRRGAHRHAARQRRWRQQRTEHPAPASEIVTHHACSTSVAERTVSAALRTGELADGDAHKNNDNDGAGSSGSAAVAAVLTGRCDFCQARAARGSGPDPVTGHGAGVAPVAATLRGTA